MADATTEFFDGLQRRGHEPLLEKSTGQARFDLETERGTEHWLVRINHGDIAVSKKNARADCIVRTDAALFERIVTGRANAMAAVLRGAVSVDGDLSLIVVFQRLFPGPPTSRRPAPALAGDGGRT